jgi:hypothetical protein
VCVPQKASKPPLNPRPQIPHERESEREGVPSHSKREGDQRRGEREKRREEDGERRGLDESNLDPESALQ